MCEQNMLSDKLCIDYTDTVFVFSGFRGCQLGQDDSWNMTWPSTGIRRTAKQKCLGSSETKGIVFFSKFMTARKKTTLKPAVFKL